MENGNEEIPGDAGFSVHYQMGQRERQQWRFRVSEGIKCPRHRNQSTHSTEAPGPQLTGGILLQWVCRTVDHPLFRNAVLNAGG